MRKLLTAAAAASLLPGAPQLRMTFTPDPAQPKQALTRAWITGDNVPEGPITKIASVSGSPFTVRGT